MTHICCYKITCLTAGHSFKDFSSQKQWQMKYQMKKNDRNVCFSSSWFSHPSWISLLLSFFSSLFTLYLFLDQFNLFFYFASDFYPFLSCLFKLFTSVCVCVSTHWQIAADIREGHTTCSSQHEASAQKTTAHTHTCTQDTLAVWSLYEL